MIQQILAQEDSVVELSDCREVNLREPQRTQRTQGMTFAPQLGLPALGRFPQFSAFDEVDETLTEVEAENSRNRPNMAFFLLPPSAVALLRLPATVNKIHLVP